MNERKQKISKFLICLILLILVSGVIQYFKTEAAYTSYDVDGIDESKYPGYKTAIKKLQEEHPNWKFKLYYTGLDWQTVINNESTGHNGSPKSLIYDTYNGEWICPTCGTTKYDLSQRWYCASQEAIKYMMDPRNALTDEYVFQFQDLSSSIGDREAIKKMVENTFLYNDSYIDAIMNAAKSNSVSPFHIVSRILLEQGNDGEGVYAKGIEYNGRTVYNLFNIGATGGAGEYENGAKRAYDEGWFSVESSIQGGTRFIKTNYINRGQVSLYFQKYNVVEAGNFYNHQYMQNIGAARTEGLNTYNGYKKNGIENSSFEFVIPLYQNMPQYASYRPNDSYMGQINTALSSMNLIESNGHKFISGDIDIAEWINDTCYTPKGTPTLYLKSTDGTFNQQLYSYYKQGITYYYDTIVDTLDVTKSYYIEVHLNSPRNAGTEPMKIQRVNFANKELGKCSNGTIIAEDSLLKFRYVGEINTVVNEMELIVSNGTNYIRGTVDIGEWVNGQCKVPGTLPELTLKSTDGTFSQNMFRYLKNGLTYYFDTPIGELDTTKEYYIQAKLNNNNNIGTDAQKTQTFSFANKNLGTTLKGNHIKCEDNRIKFSYSGKIKTQIENINMQDNGAGKHYISGNVQIKEEIDGKEMNPSTLPELSLKTEDGYVQKMYIHDSGEGNYYFDTYIEDLDRSKQYYIEAKLTNVNNTAEESEKTQTIKIGDMQLGKAGEYKVIVKENKIEFIDATKYIGSIETRLENINMNANGEGKHYISGNVQILEKVDGEEKEPRALPSLELKTEEGYSQKMYVHNSGGGNYYFDTYIEDIDQSKQYYIEAKLTNDKNIATDSEKTQTITIENKELGKVKDKKVVIRNSKIQFKDGDKYEGSISTKLREGIYFKDNGAGKHYISGNVQILESIEGEKDVPSTKPSLTLKTKDGYSQTMYVYDSGKGNYYFDTYIEDLDKSKEYYIEAKLTNTNNIAAESKKVQKVELPDKELGKVKGQKAVIKNSNIQFKDGDKYEGKISTKLTEGIYLRDNGQGKHYICGNVQIQEIIDGKANEPNAKPSLTLKTEDGYSQEMYVSNIGKGNYYFDTYIEDLDKSKEYYIEAKLTSTNNTSTQKTQNISIVDGKLGNIKENTVLVSIENNKFVFSNINPVKSIEVQENIKENEEQETSTEPIVQ